jgi:hypothetical protein
MCGTFLYSFKGNAISRQLVLSFIKQGRDDTIKAKNERGNPFILTELKANTESYPASGSTLSVNTLGGILL